MFFTVSCTTASLFPKIEKAVNEESSFIVLEAKYPKDFNTADAYFYPVVTDHDGNKIGFNVFETGHHDSTYYFRENVRSGNYTISGFRYFYTTHGEPASASAENLKSEFFPFPDPVIVHVRPGKMETIGLYEFNYETIATKYPLSDMRWKIIWLEYGNMEPDNTDALKKIKNWTSGQWVKWNIKNEETAEQLQK